MTSLVLKADGTVHSEARHYPYGEQCWSTGTVPTDYRFTGQRSEQSLSGCLTRYGGLPSNHNGQSSIS